jgi:tetratricopeptide (TPR) repeat protein
MKFGQFIHILAIIACIACVIPPASAADAVPADEATTFYNAGEVLLEQGEYTRAIASFDQALASNTTLIRQSDALLYTYRDKGYAQIQLKDYLGAIQTFEQGLALYPKDKMLWNNKGYSLYNLERFQEALTSYDMAISLDKDYTTALINKGDTLSKMGQYQAAVDIYTRALETDPGNRDAGAGLAAARQAASESTNPAMIIGVILVIIIVALGAVWYFKFRKPEEMKPEAKKPDEKKSKGKKK